MDSRHIPKQMMEFNKATFDNSINALIALQVQTEKYAFDFIDKAAWLPDEGKKAITEWVKSYKKGFENLKATTDENYKRMAELFGKEQTAFVTKTVDEMEKKMEEANKAVKLHRHGHKS